MTSQFNDNSGNTDKQNSEEREYFGRIHSKMVLFGPATIANILDTRSSIGEYWEIFKSTMFRIVTADEINKTHTPWNIFYLNNLCFKIPKSLNLFSLIFWQKSPSHE